MAESRKAHSLQSWLAGLRDVSVIVALAAAVISFLGLREEFQKDVEARQQASRNVAVAKSILATTQRIQQDVLFRQFGPDPCVSDIVAEYSRIAYRLAPNDPFVATYSMYARLVELVRDPRAQDANEILALSYYPETLKREYPQYSTIVDGIDENWLYYSGVAMLNLIVKGRTSGRSETIALFDRAYEVLDSAMQLAIKRQDHRRVVQIGSALVQHAFRGAQFGLPTQGKEDDYRHVFDVCEKSIAALRADGSRKAMITALDAKANLAHLKGQYFHLERHWDAAIRSYQEALAAYEELAFKFPQRANPKEVELVKEHLADAKAKRGMGDADSKASGVPLHSGRQETRCQGFGGGVGDLGRTWEPANG